MRSPLHNIYTLCVSLRHLRRLWQLLPLLLLPALVGCDVEGPLGECPYNARLEYWYSRKGATNVLPEYIHKLEEFIFDESGVLVQINSRTGKKNIASELNLPPGSYTLVAWGNRDTASHINRMQIGLSRIDEMELYLDTPSQSYAPQYAVQGKSEPLYYGFLPFTISGRGVSRNRINMTHSHHRLGITVRWKGVPPEDTGNFRFSLRNVAATYGFIASDSLTSGEVQNYFPFIDKRRTDYSIRATMGMGRTVKGTFYTYRLTDACHPMLRLYAGDRPLMKEIDLSTFFRTMQIGLNRNLRQEFDLVIEIDGNSILVFTAVVSDWEDGGSIGGGF